jgi:hypothetical protein
MSKIITHLSFSKLKALAHSPKKLKEYMEKKKEQTDAMVEGSLFDCLLFEPEKLQERFFVVEKPDRRTNVGKAAWAAAISEAGERSIVTTEQVESCKFLDVCIRENSTVCYHGLLNPDFFAFQQKVEFFINGFKHIGYVDAKGHNRNGDRVIWDLKRMGAKSGEKQVRWTIRDMKYDLQAAIYCHEYDTKNEPCRYFVIAIDNDGYVTPFEITRDAREQMRREWMQLISAAHRCNMEGLDMGTEFWADSSGFFQY